MTDPISTAVAEAIARRRAKTYSQTFLALHAGLSSQSRASRIERGECSPSLDELVGIAAALSVPASQLLREAEDQVAGRAPTTVVDRHQLEQLARANAAVETWLNPSGGDELDLPGANDLIRLASLQERLACAQINLLRQHQAACALVG